jgi:hypothetical protein
MKRLPDKFEQGDLVTFVQHVGHRDASIFIVIQASNYNCTTDLIRMSDFTTVTYQSSGLTLWFPW